MRRLTGYRDPISLTYDQTLRGILRGLQAEVPFCFDS